MNKYDYGYELADASTNKWAFSQIPNYATILELGPSNGNLIYHLTNQKKCIADIVELDEESGNQAACFARNACIGINEGNLEKDLWFQKLKDNRYDFIIILDVLEHIRNPKEVLLQTSTLLNENGKILLSIPNIAHNSVIINLLQNKLEYTSVGLLDDTHVHFYTYQSVLQMLKSVGLTIESSEVKQVAVNNNEIDATYGFLPREVDAFIKTRNLGTAYQFLLTITKSSVNSEKVLELVYQTDTLYTVEAFDATSRVIAEKKVNPLEEIKLDIPILEDSEEIRIDPLDTNCIISAVILNGKKENGEVIPLSVTKTTGNQFEDKYVFYGDDPQLYTNVPIGIKIVSFSYHVDTFDNTALAILAPSRDIFRQACIDYLQARELYENAQLSASKLQKSLEDTNNIKLELQAEKEQADQNFIEANKILVDMQADIDKKNNMIVDMQIEIERQSTMIACLQEELNNIASTIWGKLYHKLKS